MPIPNAILSLVLKPPPPLPGLDGAEEEGRDAEEELDPVDEDRVSEAVDED